MPGVLREVDQGSSLTGWHLTRDLNEAQERALHLWGARDRRSSKHTPAGRSIRRLAQEEPGDQRSQGRGSEGSAVGNGAREIAGQSHRAFQA